MKSPLPSENMRRLVDLLESSSTLIRPNDASEAVQLAAVERNGFAIQHIKTPSEAVQLAAVKQNGNAIQWIKDPSESVQLAAVGENSYAIQYLKDTSDAVKIAAIKAINLPGSVIQYINNITPSFLADKEVKALVIKDMLVSIKADRVKYAEQTLEHLRMVNCPWPELDVIERSLQRRVIKEDLDDHIKSAIMSKFNTGPIQVMEMMDRYGVTVKDMPEAADYLEKHKGSMIKKLVMQIKNHDYEGNILNTLALTRAVELDWSELDIIERTFEHQYQRTTEDQVDESADKPANIENMMQSLRYKGIEKHDIKDVMTLIKYLDQFSSFSKWRASNAAFDDAYYVNLPLDEINIVTGLSLKDLHQIVRGTPKYAGHIFKRGDDITIFGKE